jgi:DHA1 family bicyclomycin/chloramphenicol resistance-like MFS transporter
MALVALSGLADPGRLGPAPLAVLMALYCVGFGICIPIAAAGAIAPFPKLAGTAASALGVLQTGSAALVGFLVGQLHDDSAAPMAIAVAAMGAVAAIGCRLLMADDRTPPDPAP